MQVWPRERFNVCCWGVSFILPPWAREVESKAPDLWGYWGLGPRLGALAHYVPQGARVLDVGTDHALLPEALVRAEWVERVVGIDCAADALEHARSRLRRGSVCVELRLSSGLRDVEENAFDSLVMAGFGARKMIEVLQEVPPEVLGIQRLVLQPTAGMPRLRRWLIAAGWNIERETIVREGARGFLTSTAVRRWDSCQVSVLTPFESLVGQVDIDHPLLWAWLQSQRDHLHRQGERSDSLRREVEDFLARKQKTEF